MNAATKQRTFNQRTKILEALRLSGVNGLTNEQLSKIALRFNARIQELYVQGYGIDVYITDNGISTYTLISEPISTSKKPQDALTVLMDEINTLGGSIHSNQLLSLLENLNFTVRRKVGTFNKRLT